MLCNWRCLLGSLVFFSYISDPDSSILALPSCRAKNWPQDLLAIHQIPPSQAINNLYHVPLLLNFLFYRFAKQKSTSLIFYLFIEILTTIAVPLSYRLQLHSWNSGFPWLMNSVGVFFFFFLVCHRASCGSVCGVQHCWFTQCEHVIYILIHVFRQFTLTVIKILTDEESFSLVLLLPLSVLDSFRPYFLLSS